MDFSFLNKVIELYKPSFEAYIKDISVPIEKRWASFISAPYEMKTHYPYIEDLLWDGKKISWYDDFYIEKHQTVTAESLVEMLHDYKEASEETINDMKEQILQKNLGSFEYDW